MTGDTVLCPLDEMFPHCQALKQALQTGNNYSAVIFQKEQPWVLFLLVISSSFLFVGDKQGK